MVYEEINAKIIPKQRGSTLSECMMENIVDHTLVHWIESHTISMPTLSNINSVVGLVDFLKEIVPSLLMPLWYPLDATKPFATFRIWNQLRIAMTLFWYHSYTCYKGFIYKHSKGTCIWECYVFDAIYIPRKTFISRKIYPSISMILEWYKPM